MAETKKNVYTKLLTIQAELNVPKNAYNKFGGYNYRNCESILEAIQLRQLRIHLQCKRPGFNPWVGKILWRREWLSAPVFLPGESHG